jgi:hypothetical protein
VGFIKNKCFSYLTTSISTSNIYGKRTVSSSQDVFRKLIKVSHCTFGISSGKRKIFFVNKFLKWNTIQK